jgi:hypothetical protein
MLVIRKVFTQTKLFGYVKLRIFCYINTLFEVSNDGIRIGKYGLYWGK